MHNSHTLARREFAVREGLINRLYGKGTGSIIVDAHSVDPNPIPGEWDFLLPITIHSQGLHSATTGALFVVIKNSVEHPERAGTPELNPEAAMPSVTLSPASILDKVRSVFDLNISETAEVFGITRQTAYQWMKLSDMEQVRSHENRDRIKQLYGAAQFWQSLPRLSGRWLHAILPTGHTVFDLLKTPAIDLDGLRAAYDLLEASTMARRRDEGERSTRAATAMANALTGLGAGRKAREG